MGFRFRHLIAAGGAAASRSAVAADSTPMPLYVNDSGSGAIVYVAPEWPTYDSSGSNPDVKPTNVQNLYGIWVVSDKAVSLHGVASDISFSLYRAGSQIGGGVLGSWATSLNPAFTLGVPVQVPFSTSNTALVAVPTNGAGTAAVTATSAYLPLQPGDCILCTAATPADLVNLYGFVVAA